MQDIQIQVRLAKFDKNGRNTFQSGRGVRMRMLSAAEWDDLQASVAMELGKDGNMVAYKNQVQRQGLMLSITAITPPDLDPKVSLDDAAWTTVTQQQLEMAGPFQFVNLFNTKEINTLGLHFTKLHDTTLGELEDSEGNVVSAPSS